MSGFLYLAGYEPVRVTSAAPGDPDWGWLPDGVMPVVLPAAMAEAILAGFGPSEPTLIVPFDPATMAVAAVVPDPFEPELMTAAMTPFGSDPFAPVIPAATYYIRAFIMKL